MCFIYIYIDIYIYIGVYMYERREGSFRDKKELGGEQGSDGDKVRTMNDLESMATEDPEDRRGVPEV